MSKHREAEVMEAKVLQMPLASHPIYVGFAHKVVKQIVGVDTFIISCILCVSVCVPVCLFHRLIPCLFLLSYDD